MKLLTVLVPCYNSESLMRKCLDSVMIDDNRLDVLIIDDGSKDNTPIIADEYQEKYPNIVRVIHQENGGHGEGLNQGIKHGLGKYFKALDSDDFFSSDLKLFLDTLERIDEEGGVDLFITDYRYVNNGVQGKVISYKKQMPKDKVFGWDEVKKFKPQQFITIHSATFSMKVLRETNIELPKHISYEDNYYIHGNLQNVKRLYYMNIDLYQYTIGRAEQSTSKENIVKHYDQQVLVTTLMFKSYHLDDERFTKGQVKYMYHSLYMFFAITCVLAHTYKGGGAADELKKMWNEVIEYDEKLGKKLRYRTIIRTLNMPGKLGHIFGSFLYKIAHLFVRFN
ncbi:glycosyltransferase family 2 protein [bacterium]|nr:glycosyltransferase family 2 protein [bacterium]